MLTEGVDEGAVIVSVEDGYPAKESGIQKGDVIIAVNDITVKNTAHFRAQLYKYSIGDTITLTINRDGKEIKVTVKLTKSANS